MRGGGRAGARQGRTAQNSGRMFVFAATLVPRRRDIRHGNVGERENLNPRNHRVADLFSFGGGEKTIPFVLVSPGLAPVHRPHRGFRLLGNGRRKYVAALMSKVVTLAVDVLQYARAWQVVLGLKWQAHHSHKLAARLYVRCS